jgi:uncharacterized membrane protein
MTLETNKTLGGIGALLIVIGFVGVFGSGYAGILDLIGIILVLIAMKGFGDHYKEDGIFNNALYGVILSIVGAVAFVGAIVVGVLQLLSTGFDWTNAAMWQEEFMDFANLWNFIGTIIIALVVLFIFAVISAIFYRKSLSLLAKKSGVNMFSTAGLLLLIGAVLTIIIVGFILILVAVILIAVGFFSIKTEPAQPPPVPPPS